MVRIEKYIKYIIKFASKDQFIKYLTKHYTLDQMVARVSELVGGT